MEKITGNESAMPLVTNGGTIQDGLTIRQHFAAMAYQTLLHEYLKKADDTVFKHEVINLNGLASVAIEAADALIAELNKPIK